MKLPIHSITLSGKDGCVYLCLRVPEIEGTERMSTHVTIKFSGDSHSALVELYKKEAKGDDQD